MNCYYPKMVRTIKTRVILKIIFRLDEMFMFNEFVPKDQRFNRSITIENVRALLRYLLAICVAGGWFQTECLSSREFSRLTLILNIDYN
jgi:hypothetical protein